MKRYLLIAVLFCCAVAAQAQADTDTLRARAQALLIKGDYDNALLVLNHAAEMDPENKDILNDKAYIYYLQRDFAKTIELGKQITSHPNANAQDYQVLGLAYKATADYTSAEKLYKKGLKHFPKSGVLYSEYGDMLAQQNRLDEAIKQWEKGIQADPNNSNNYYYAARYYSSKSRPLWAVIYSETFVNIESLTPRTVEIKDILLSNYRKLLTTGQLQALTQSNSPFEKAVANTYLKYTGMFEDELSPETLTAIRARFILDWYANNGTAPLAFRLYDHHRLLLEEGMFDAYNQWLFGPSASSSAYQYWTSNHSQEMKDW